MTYSLEIFSASIVFVGDFNPAIFTADWLEKNELIGATDANFIRKSESTLVSHQVTRFETDWFILQVLEQQLSITSKGNVTDSLKDLVTGVFTLLNHSPVKGLGLNSTAHYKIDTEINYHKIGNTLAPKTIWNSVFGNTQSGLENLAIRIEPKDGDGNLINNGNFKLITLQPSVLIPCSVCFMTNNHYNIEALEPKVETKATLAIKILNEDWESNVIRSEDSYKNILDQILN